MPESNNGPTEDERGMMRWVKKEYGLEDEKPSDLMRWSLQARHAVLKRDVQIGELKAEIERLRLVIERLRLALSLALNDLRGCGEYPLDADGYEVLKSRWRQLRELDESDE